MLVRRVLKMHARRGHDPRSPVNVASKTWKKTRKQIFLWSMQKEGSQADNLDFIPVKLILES